METLWSTYEALASFFGGELSRTIFLFCVVVILIVTVIFAMLRVSDRILIDCNQKLTEAERQREIGRADQKRWRQMEIVSFAPVLFMAAFLAFRILALLV